MKVIEAVARILKTEGVWIVLRQLFPRDATLGITLELLYAAQICFPRTRDFVEIHWELLSVVRIAFGVSPVGPEYFLVVFDYLGVFRRIH